MIESHCVRRNLHPSHMYLQKFLEGRFTYSISVLLRVNTSVAFFGLIFLARARFEFHVPNGHG